MSRMLVCEILFCRSVGLFLSLMKRKQALLGSNLPRDSRIRRENDSVASGGFGRRAFFRFPDVILLSCHALKTLWETRRQKSKSRNGQLSPSSVGFVSVASFDSFASFNESF